MSGKYALIIGNTEYIDPGLAQLTAPSKDAENFARVLKDQDICAFDDVKVLLNQPESAAREAIDEFFDQKRSDDLLVLYFSGHGIRDELGTLYLAVKNTNRFRLRSTAIKSDFIQEAMDQSRSKRQVLILDCCNSGAFAQGTKAATGTSIGTASAFEAGYGRVILTASDATQFAWEGDKVIGETDNSLFTHFLVEGLKGEADLDRDGCITVDELYDYAYEKVRFATPKQTPSKFSSKQQGEIILRRITRIEDVQPVSLSDQLISEIENPYPEVRLRAVQQLAKLLKGKNLGLARSAREALERMEKEDDSRTVSRSALQALEAIRQAEKVALQNVPAEQRMGEETEQPAPSKAEEELVERKKNKVKEVRKTDINTIQGKPKSIFAFHPNRQKPKTIFVAIGVIALLVGVWISLPGLVFLSSNSASEQSVMAPLPAVKITQADYAATHLLLNGILIELEVKTTTAQKNQPCQVIVYFQRTTGEDLMASRSLTNIISPYITRDKRVAVYTEFVPSFDRSIWSVKLFMPYAAIGTSGLPDGESSLKFYAELYGNDYGLIARSPSMLFTYTK